MAARKPEPGTEVQTTSVEQDVAAEQNAAAIEGAETVPAGDPRESALAALVYGNSTPEAVVTAETELVVDDSEILDFGGRSKALVTYSYYRQLVDGKPRTAKKGQVIKTDADALAKGVKLGALKKYGE